MKKLVKESLSEFLNEDIFKGEIKTGLTAEDVDPKEFLVGIEVEQEHSKDLAVAKTIALQHLVENPKYYSEGMKKGIFDEPAAINLYKKYFIDKEEVKESMNMNMEDVDENLKQELITKIMNTVYEDDDPKNDETNRMHLETLSIDQLEEKLSDYYMYDIKRIKREKNN